MTRPDESRVRDIKKKLLLLCVLLLLTALSLGSPSLGGVLSLVVRVKFWRSVTILSRRCFWTRICQYDLFKREENWVCSKKRWGIFFIAKFRNQAKIGIFAPKRRQVVGFLYFRMRNTQWRSPMEDVVSTTQIRLQRGRGKSLRKKLRRYSRNAN